MSFQKQIIFNVSPASFLHRR